MTTPSNPFTSAREHNAIFPWSHEINPFCTCTTCHTARRTKILAKCNMILVSIEMLEWPEGVPAATLPNVSYEAAAPTTIRRNPCL